MLGSDQFKNALKNMAEEKTLGLKQEKETKPSSGTGQPEPKTPDTTPEDLEKEIDDTLKDDKEVKSEDLGDGTVVLTKEELERIKDDKANYKKALLSLKPKLKAFKKPTPPPQDKSEFITRSEYQKGIEKQAIKAACQDPDVNDNWGKIMEYYVPRQGKTSVEGITADVKRAHRLYRLENPLSPEDEGKKAAAALAAEKSKPGGEAKSSGKKSERKRILSKPTSVQEWYGEPEQK